MVYRQEGVRRHAQRDGQAALVCQVAAEDGEERVLLHGGGESEPYVLQGGYGGIEDWFNTGSCELLAIRNRQNLRRSHPEHRHG